MSEQSGHLLDSLTGRQRLLDRFDRLEKLLQEQAERAEQQREKLDHIERRLEEAIAYFAIRSNRLMDSQSVYLGDNTAVTFLENGIRILVDTRSIDIGIHLLTLGRWETAYTTLFTRLVKPGDTVIDLGPNHGVYALLAAQIVGPTGRVDAFEPNPRLAKLVDLSLRLNGFASWARVHALGASEAMGTARLVFNDNFSGGGAVALDDMFADPTYRPDVIKMDVEGHEGRALRGMRRILERSPDVRIMMEFGPAMMRNAGVGAPEVTAFFESLGHSAWTIDDQGGVVPTTWAALAGQTEGLQNILVARQAPVL